MQYFILQNFVFTDLYSVLEDEVIFLRTSHFDLESGL